MGETCSTCNTKNSGKTEIVHIQRSDNLKQRPKVPNSTNQNTPNRKLDKVVNQKDIHKSKINSKAQTQSHHRNSNPKTTMNNDSFMELKQTASFGGHQNIVVSELVSQTKKVKVQEVLSEYSLNTEGLKKLNEKYLSNLFESVKQKIEVKSQLKDQVQELDYILQNQQQPSVTKPPLPPKRSSLSSSRDSKVNRSLFTRVNKYNIYQKYTIDTKISQDHLGEIYKATDKILQQKRAIKIIKKRRLHHTKGAEEKLFTELKILKQIDHPNIIKLYDVVDYKNNYYIITEYYQSVALLQVFQRIKNWTERHVAHIMTQILSCVNYMGEKGIVHRDIRLEKIMLEMANPMSSTLKVEEGVVKMVSFKTASHWKKGEMVKAHVGSPYYMSPEIIKKGESDEKADVWACGIIMYFLFSGNPPFVARTEKEIKDLVLKDKIKMQGDAWSKVSSEAKDLVKLMLDPDPLTRISSQDALKHKWFTHRRSISSIPLQIFTNIQKFILKNKFQAVISTFLASKTISDSDRKSLILKFKQIDQDSSGLLETKEIISAYKQIYGPQNQSKIQEIMNNIDSDQSGKIDLTEFMMATIEHQKLFNRKALEEAWSYFDKDSTGYLDLGELQVIIGESTEEELREIMTELGAEGERLSKEKFMELFEIGEGEKDKEGKQEKKKERKKEK